MIEQVDTHLLRVAAAQVRARELELTGLVRRAVVLAEAAAAHALSAAPAAGRLCEEVATDPTSAVRRAEAVQWAESLLRSAAACETARAAVTAAGERVAEHLQEAAGWVEALEQCRTPASDRQRQGVR